MEDVQRSAEISSTRRSVCHFFFNKFIIMGLQSGLEIIDVIVELVSLE